MTGTIKISDRLVGPDSPVYIIAELSANHHQEYETAAKLIEAAKKLGADAVKLQTYTADTMTIRSGLDHFRIRGGTLWDGRTLHDLYTEGYTPWEWQPKLKRLADDLDIHLFSSPFDATAVDFLESMDVPAYKVASFELVDIPLIEKIARTGKPIVMSVGMASLEEIDEAMTAARSAGAEQIALLKCTSAYPASADEMNLKTIPDLAHRFNVPVGLSDHSMDIAVPVAAVALGACIIEKHLTMSRSLKGPDNDFSLEPDEFETMIKAVRIAQRSLGEIRFGSGDHEISSRAFRRSLFVVEDMKKGQAFTANNVRSIRPSQGLHTRYLKEILTRRASRDIERGTPLSWDLISGTGDPDNSVGG